MESDLKSATSLGGHPRQMVKAILFDLFGTVIAYGDVVRGTRLAWEGVYSVLCGLGATVPYERFANEWQSSFVTPLAPGEDVAETPFLSKMLRFFESYGLPRNADAAAQAVRNCLAGWDMHVNLPADAVPTLEALRASYALALVTNFDHPPYARMVLSRYGLVELFDVIVISGEVHVDKPDPRIFHLALDALHCAPTDALFVGDSLDSDIAGASAVGCRPVLMDMGNRHPAYEGERIRSLGELPGLLDR